MSRQGRGKQGQGQEQEQQQEGGLRGTRHEASDKSES